MNSIIFQNQTFVPVGVSAGLTELDGEQLIRVVKPEENTEPDVATYARLVGSDFHDGTIEVDVRARLMQHVMLIGSWAELLYERVGLLEGFEPSIKTMDIDFLVRNMRRPVPEVQVVAEARGQSYLVESDLC